jgi:hypothetical protein
MLEAAHGGYGSLCGVRSGFLSLDCALYFFLIELFVHRVVYDPLGQSEDRGRHSHS